MKQSIRFERDNEGKLIRITKSVNKAVIDGGTEIGEQETLNRVTFEKEKELFYIEEGKKRIAKMEEQQKQAQEAFKVLSDQKIQLTTKDIEKLDAILKDVKANYRLKKIGLQNLDNLAERLIQYRNVIDMMTKLEHELRLAREEMDAYLSLKNGER